MTNCICGMPLGEFGYGIAILITAIVSLWIGSKIKWKKG